MPTVLVTPPAFYAPTRPLHAVLRDAGFDVRLAENPRVPSGTSSVEETIAEWIDADAVIAGGEFATAEVIAGLPRLRVIARAGVGYDRVDIEAATSRGIPVTITPNANHECVAEHTLALLFAVARSIAHLDREMREGRWISKELVPLRGRTIGLVGLGRIGRSVAPRCRALGMKVLAHDEYANEDFARENEIELVSLDDLLASSDFVSLHCPLDASTEKMFNAERFARMKAGSLFINTARGGLVDEPALVAALESGHVAGAGLDVYDVEPLAADHVLSKLENVVLCPHLGGADTTSLENMGVESAENIIRLHRGEWPEGAVVNDSLRGTYFW